MSRTERRQAMMDRQKQTREMLNHCFRPINLLSTPSKYTKLEVDTRRDESAIPWQDQDEAKEKAPRFEMEDDF